MTSPNLITNLRHVRGFKPNAKEQRELMVSHDSRGQQSQRRWQGLREYPRSIIDRNGGGLTEDEFLELFPD